MNDSEKMNRLLDLALEGGEEFESLLAEVPRIRQEMLETLNKPLRAVLDPLTLSPTGETPPSPPRPLKTPGNTTP
jgi:hypothetical protein